VPGGWLARPIIKSLRNVARPYETRTRENKEDRLNLLKGFENLENVWVVEGDEVASFYT
jgi:hypothetical protein